MIDDGNSKFEVIDNMNVTDFKKLVDDNVDGFEIEGTIKFYTKNKLDSLPFKATVESGFLGTGKKEFKWKSTKIPENFDDVYCDVGSNLIKMMNEYLVNYDLRSTVPFKMKTEWREKEDAKREMRMYKECREKQKELDEKK